MITKQTYREGDYVQVHGDNGEWVSARIIEGNDYDGYRVRYNLNVDGTARWRIDRMRKDPYAH